MAEERLGAELGKGLFWVSDPWYMERSRFAEAMRLVGPHPDAGLGNALIMPKWSGLVVPLPELFDEVGNTVDSAWDFPLLALPQDIYVRRPGETRDQYAWRVIAAASTVGLMDLGGDSVPAVWGRLQGYEPSDENAVAAAGYWQTAEADVPDSEKGVCAWLEADRRNVLDACIQLWGKRVLPSGRVTVDYDSAAARRSSDVLAQYAEQASSVLSACNGVRLSRSDSADEREQGRSILAWMFDNDEHFRGDLRGQAQPDVVGWARENEGLTRDYLGFLVDERLDPSAKKGLQLLDEIIGGGTPAAA